MDKKVVVGIGELLWDLLPTGKQLGGAPCNFAFHASQAGCESLVISAVANDEAGNEIKSTMHSLGLSTKYIQSNSQATGTVSVSLADNGQPNYTIHENVAWDNIIWENSLNDLAKRSDAVCFGSLAQRDHLSESTIQEFLKNLPEKCLKVFDINLRQQFYSAEIIEKSLQQANVLKLNEDELPVVAALFSLTGNVESQLKSLLHKFDLKYIAYTKGGEGSILLSANEMSYLESPKVKVVDTVGAGDSFTAILIAGLLHDLPLNIIHKKANEVAAFVCESKGATPIIDKKVIQFNT